MNETDLIIAEVIEDEINSDIPAERTPSNKREFFFNPPDWRYQTALKYLQDERKGITPVIPTDPIVQFTIRALRAYRNIHTRVFVDILWEEVRHVFYLGITAKNSAVTAEIEALLIRGRKAKQLKEEEFYLSPSVYELYSKIFFDLSGITAIHSWVNDFLFEPEKYSDNTTILRNRLLAYYGSTPKGLNSTIMGSVDKTEDSIMKSIMNTERSKKVFDYVVKASKIDSEEYVGIMEAAVKSMSEQAFQEHMKDRDQAGSSSLEEMAENIEQGIRAFSQQEVDQVSETGLDFVNQYTAAILRKDQ